MSTTDTESIVNIAAYKFFPWSQIDARRIEFRELCNRLELKGTILLSTEGINLFLAGPSSSIREFLSYVRSIPELSDLQVKESMTDYQPFNRMLVKLKKEIIPVGIDGISPETDASPKISPLQLKQWLDSGRPVNLLDTRNDYEIELGTFEGAIDLNIQNFRQFPKAASALPDTVKEQPVVMFCTGGIRCEKIGPYMKGLGFREIYQLEGGILKYFEECNQSHYRGDCFVFDQRVAVDPALHPSDCSECFACKHPLTPDDMLSEKYVPAKSCPHCFRTDSERLVMQRSKRQAMIQSIALRQRGCTPYTNRRWISIPQRCDGMSLIDALVTYYPGYSRDQWLHAIHSKEIQKPAGKRDVFESVAVTPEQPVRSGERLIHSVANYVEPAIAPDIRLVYEDDAIVVIDKSAPLPLHPSGRFNLNSLESILLEAYHPEKLRPTHRLDSNTLGIVVFARRFKYAQSIQKQFAEESVQKIYRAKVIGLPEWDSLRCELPIGAEPLPGGGRAVVYGGQGAVTEFRVIERLHEGETIIEAIPRTGRTHQIRLHLAALGFPVVNDPIYLAGGQARETPAPDSANKPMGLQSYQIAFVHPLTHETVQYQSVRTI